MNKFKPLKEFKERKFGDRLVGGSVKAFATQTEGVSLDEFNRRKNTRECMRCAWLADRKANNKTVDCYRSVQTDTETAHYPKAKEYQKLREGAYELEEDRKDMDTDGSDSEELSDTVSKSESSKLESSGSESSESWQIGGHNN
jgi:hypothetical protein